MNISNSTWKMKALTALMLAGAIALSVVAPLPTRAADAAGELESRFKSPPADARPWVYWYWMNGNVTREGIRADLQAMKDAGIGGAMLFDIGIHPAGPVKIRSREWFDLVRFAVEEAAAREIKISFHCPGWSASGGPWITPELAMQELTWSETVVEGPREFSAPLAKPPTRLGYYHDAAVVAFPTPAGDELALKDLHPRFLDAAGKPLPEAARLFDGNLDTPVAMPAEFYIAFERPVSVRSLFLRSRRQDRLNSASLQAWNPESKKFEPVVEISLHVPGPFSSHAGSATFPEVRAKTFRLTFPGRSPTDTISLEQLDLRGGFRVADWTQKAGFSCDQVAPGTAGTVPSADVIPSAQVMDLSARLTADGKLNWTVPAGRWTILRVGHTPTGVHIYPPPVGGDGLECDKLSRAAADFHYDRMMKPLLQEFGPELSRRALACYHVDSNEAGWQNWTANLPQEFRARLGYDLIRYLPAVTGRVVDDLATTERWLWDFRRTIGDLYADNHYGRLAERCHEDGLDFSTEPYGGPFEILQCGGRADHPMVEFWLPTNSRDRKIAFHGVFAGRTTGRRIIGSEAFTSEEGWNQHPFSLKAIGDYIYCSGVNQFVLHVFAQQPYTNDHLRPGFTCGPNGVHFDRGNTWWSQGRAWVSYLTCCQSLLQAGEHVADTLYFQGNDSPKSVGPFEPPLPDGWDYDACGSEVLQRITVQDGRIVLPHGKSYRYLVLPDQGRMTLASLRKIAGLANSGATVIGPPVKESPSLADYPSAPVEIEKLDRELWGAVEPARSGTRAVGRGRVIWGTSFDDILKQDVLPPDFDFERNAGVVIHYTHRRSDSADLYFVANATDSAGWVNCRFRVSGKVPELWHPDTGVIERCALFEEAGGTTRIPLHFDRAGSQFVVFRERAGDQPALVGASRDGENLLGRAVYPETVAPQAPDQNRAVTNDFTVAFWARPDADIPLPREAASGVAWDGQNWAVYPPPGHVLYGENRAGAGVSVGRNGICVFEHWGFNVPPLLVYQSPRRFTDWAHVAVVFRKGQPSLYVNGKFARSGLTTGKTVHAGVGVAITSHQVPPFMGWLAEVVQYPQPLSASDIAGLAKARPKELPGELNEAPEAQFTAEASGAVRARVWRQGQYEFKLSNGQTRRLEVSMLPGPLQLTNAWKVRFPQGWGAPAEISLPQLVSWTDHPVPGVRYFSGTAIYETEFDLPVDFTNRPVALDLGDVQVIAEPVLNGQELGILWKPPFRADAANAIRPGRNRLQVRITNLWPNRLIGDEQFPDDCSAGASWTSGGIPAWPDWLLKGQPRPEPRRLTFATFRYWKGNDTLLPSGLLGPVTLWPAERLEIK